MRRHTQEDRERFGAWLTERIPDDMTPEEMENWERNGIATTRVLRKGFRPSVGPLFRLVTQTNIGPTDARPTSACLFGKRWAQRSHDFSRWLPLEQPATQACSVTVLATMREGSYQEWAAALLQVPEDTSEHELEERLLKRHVLTLPQMEVLVKRTDGWVMQTLLIEDPGNFFFTANNVGGISVMSIQCKQDWKPYLKGFASQHQRVLGCHLIVANVDVSQLDLA